jgi:hypothetical protein
MAEEETAMRLRQVALVAHDLDPVVEALCTTLGIRVAFRDPGVRVFGLRNAVMPVGDTFLEVVSPVEAGTSAGRFLERRGGDGGYMVILQTDDLAADRRRLAGLGVRVVWETTLPDIATVHLHPRDVGGAIVSLDQPEPPASWRWGGPEWERHVRTAVVDAIAGAEIQSGHPAAVARRWSEVLGRPAREVAAGEWEIALAGSWARFVPDRDGRGEGLSAVAFRRAAGYDLDLRATEICGTRLRLVS